LIGKQKKNYSRIACPPKQKNNTPNINQNEIIDANWTKDEVINFLKTKFKISQQILSKINNEEIDGESFVLLRDDDYKTLGISLIKKNKILPHVDNDILRLSNSIKQDTIYLRVEKENKDNLWNSLEEKLKGLKLGEILKYIKYSIIRDMPPNKEEEEDLYIYFQKVFDLKEEILIELKENIDDFLKMNEKDLQEQCKEWNLEGYEEFKLKIIFEIIRQREERKRRRKKGRKRRRKKGRKRRRKKGRKRRRKKRRKRRRKKRRQRRRKKRRKRRRKKRRKRRRKKRRKSERKRGS